MGQVTGGTYTIIEAAKKLGISRNTCYEAAKQGQIPTIKIGKRILVPMAALDKMLAGEGTSKSVAG